MSSDSAKSDANGLPGLFAALAGLLLGLALLKFGNPAILDRLVQPPTGFYEVLFQAWPVAWGYALLSVVGLVGLVVAQWRWPKPRWLTVLPGFWLVWQLVASSGSIEPRLTTQTLGHFVATSLCYYLGLSALPRARRLGLFWAGLVIGFALMLTIGLQQRFGGLEDTRRYVYSQPGWENLSPEYLKRLGSNRIFATLLYPNALAGAVLLLLPAVSVATWRLSSRLTLPTRVFLATLIAAGGLGCLYWSGSKAGWLFALVLAVVCLLRLPVPRAWKYALVGVCVVGGLAGFAFKFSSYFARGAPSAEARLQYWQAAGAIALAHPVTGTGPGTFGTNYRRMKSPSAEMALLTHNDYLEQACDSGLAGAVTYALFIVGSLVVLGRRSQTDTLQFAVWLGLLGWSLQGLTEFGLYIPALSWTAFLLFGWLTGQSQPTPVKRSRQTGLVR